MNPFLMFHATLWFWSASFDAMNLAMSEMFVVRRPPKLVLIIGGKS